MPGAQCVLLVMQYEKFTEASSPYLLQLLKVLLPLGVLLLQPPSVPPHRRRLLCAYRCGTRPWDLMAAAPKHAVMMCTQGHAVL